MELLLILLGLILLNGVFAASEMALVSSRSARLQARAQAGSAGARAALKLSQDPSVFLSTVQVGITTIGILSGAFGENAIAERLIGVFEGMPLIAATASPGDRLHGHHGHLLLGGAGRDRAQAAGAAGAGALRQHPWRRR
jgi:putative hemolysin